MSPALLPDGDDSVVVVKVASNLKRRRLIVGRGLRYYHFRQDIAYSQARPTQIRLPRETTRLDCSGLVACCMDFARVLPRVDWRYTNTWVQIKFGKPVDLDVAKPGDVVFYGTGISNPTHEALYLGTTAQVKGLGLTPPPRMLAGKWVLSHGHYPMNIYPIDYRSDRVQLRSFL